MVEKSLPMFFACKKNKETYGGDLWSSSDAYEIHNYNATSSTFFNF